MKTHFWAGKFENKQVFKLFFEEVYTDNDDEPVSKFAESQNETWIDHDFVEIGFEKTEKSIKEKFKNYSYAEKWLNIFECRVKEKNVGDINVIIMVSYDNEYAQINSPKSYEEENLKIEYLGQIEYEI